MPGRTAKQRQSLEKQNAAIMRVFERAGFAQIAPDIIQPADIFLERSGEDIRARTFVFNDPDGNELCLRPDLTVPACRFHLSHARPQAKEARYSYLGPAFRFPNEKLSPQEFTQAGLEWFGAKDAVAVEAKMLKIALASLAAAGAKKPAVTIGDVGLFAALLADTPMPERWRRRLSHQFWRPKAFQSLLAQLSSDAARPRSSISDVVDAIDGRTAIAVAEEWLARHSMPLQGTRSLEEIAARLTEKKADRTSTPLSREVVARLESYLALSGPAKQVVKKLDAIAAGRNFDAARENFARRMKAIEKLGLDAGALRFSASFGREIEYYTGFVFQLALGRVSVAGGGRYDDMLKDLGAKTRIPAFGFAVHCEIAGECEMKKLILGLPSKGRLMEQAQELLARAGFGIERIGSARGYRGKLTGIDNIEVAFLSAADIAEALKSGAVDLGITGEDLLRETIAPDSKAADVALRLNFGPANVVVAVPNCWLDVSRMADLDDVAAQFYSVHGRRLRVATKYANLTRRHFAQHGVTGYRIVESLGATEGAPAAGSAELIVDITTSGATLAANALKILDDGVMLESCAVLAVTRFAQKDTRLSTLIDKISGCITTR